MEQGLAQSLTAYLGEEGENVVFLVADLIRRKLGGEILQCEREGGGETSQLLIQQNLVMFLKLP